jgi:G3E family GTPase
MSSQSDGKVPITVITGFLGSGKTTLLNNILTKEHGKKIAVIENEFGEIGVDDALIKQKFDTEEEIFEMNNGCICCTVRGDLVRILGKITKRKTKLDGVIIETTGMADPAPVAQTFFMDPSIEDTCRLDAIITVVDAMHIIQHLDAEKPEGAENEAVEQLVFADRVLLNKTDLVEEGTLVEVEKRIRELNKTVRCVSAHTVRVCLACNIFCCIRLKRQYRQVPIVRCQNADVPVESVINIGAFSLEEVVQLYSSARCTVRDVARLILESMVGYEDGTRFLEPGRRARARSIDHVCWYQRKWGS